MNLFFLLKKCLGEARWSRYQERREKWEVFKILLRLRYYTEFSKREYATATQKIFGFTITGPNYAEILYLFREIFMDSQYEFKFDKNAPKILDCGANIGMAVIFFKWRYPESRILAFEPNPRIYEFLKMNVANNELQNIEIFNTGLSYQGGPIDFYVGANSLVSSLDRNRGGNELIKVRSTKLSVALIDKTFDLAKIDVEGAEWGVVKDLAETGTIRNIRQYLFEYHHNMTGVDFRLSDFLRVFEQNGFTYNLRTSFQTPGDFQDIAINLIRNTE